MKKSTQFAISLLCSLVMARSASGLDTAYLKADMPARLQCKMKGSWVCYSSKSIRKDMSVFVSAYVNNATSKAQDIEQLIPLLKEAKAGTMIKTDTVLKTQKINNAEWAQMEPDTKLPGIKPIVYETVVKLPTKLVLVQVYGLLPQEAGKNYDDEFSKVVMSLKLESPARIEQAIANLEAPARSRVQKDESIKEMNFDKVFLGPTEAAVK